MYGAQHLVQPVFRFDQLEMSAAVARQPLQQRGVDRPVDADRENSTVSRVLLDLAQQLIFVADLTVGDEQQNPLAAGVRRIGEILEGASQRRGDFGAAARLDPRQKLHRPEAVAVRRRHQPAGARRGFLDPVVEQQHPEAIPFGQRVEQAARRPPRRRHFPAFHRPGTVQHHHHVAGPERGRQGRWRHHGQQGGRFAVRVAINAEAAAHARFADPEAQDKIPIQPFRARRQFDHPEIALRLMQPQGVQTGAQVGERQPGRVQLHAKSEINRVGLSRQQHRRGDATGVGHGVGVPSGALPHARPIQSHAGDVARRHHQRETERGLAVGERQRAGQLQFDADRLAGGDVAGAHREHFGPLLFGDGGAMALANRLVVFLPRRAPLLQHPFDDPLSHPQPEPGHARSRRQRKNVGGFQRLGAGVDEFLCHHQPIEQAGDPTVHSQSPQRQATPDGFQTTETGLLDRIGGRRGGAIRDRFIEHCQGIEIRHHGSSPSDGS